MSEAYARDAADYQLNLGLARRNGRRVLLSANIVLDPVDVAHPPGFGERLAALGGLVTARNATMHGRGSETPPPAFVKPIRHIEQPDGTNPGGLTVTLDITEMSINPDVRDDQIEDACDQIVDYLCPPVAIVPANSPFLAPESQ